MQPEYESFLVRLWRNPEAEDQHHPWCGEIEHIQSGVRWSFSTLSEEIVEFLFSYGSKGGCNHEHASLPTDRRNQHQNESRS